MLFTTYQVADVSTCYLEESDLPLLLQVGCPTRVAETDGGFGSFHWVPGDDRWLEQDMEEARAYGLSERFVSIMKHLRAAKVPYVRFDADGGDVEGLDAA